MFKKQWFFLAMLLVAGALAMPAAKAWADVTVAPLRVVFQGRDRSAVVSLVNLTRNVNTYRVGWSLYKMNEKGGYTPVPLDEKDPFSVSKMVIFSPRQVRVSPEQHQLVRLSLRRPANLPQGEYRGHLTFTRLPPDRSRRQKEIAPDEKGASMSLQVHLSFSIPVIVRSGTDDALSVDFSAPKFTTNNRNGVIEPVLNMDINRVAGKFSTYGSVFVYWTKPGEKEQKIGTLNNVALYPEINRRNISISLRVPQITAGTIRVVYEGKYESKGTIWAEKTFPVGG